jgi:GT2 family glycosyltransferase
MAVAATVVISSLNEGAHLWRTVQSCVETTTNLPVEILIADDNSRDGSVEEVRHRFPDVRIVAHDRRRGVSRTKNLGARAASGGVLVFLDGHSKPEPGSLARLIDDVEQLDGRAVITPAVSALNTEVWQNQLDQVGYGYHLELTEFKCRWSGVDSLRRRGRFYESPALIGCCFAISRTLYDELGGFDLGMKQWGVEDIDFGLRAWLMGSLILNDSEAVVGHRFRRSFDNFEVSAVHPLVNQLRMARKTFASELWLEWLAACKQRHAAWPGLWQETCTVLAQERETLESQREYLLQHRMRDEYWFADYFNLSWPCRI